MTANNSVEPVDGGVVNFSAPASGASATLSAASATISNGGASVAAAANATIGRSYTVSATATGVATPASFILSNSEALSLVVDTTSDTVNPYDGLTSLREAVAYAESLSGGETITFDGSVFGPTTPETITLASGQLNLTKAAGVTGSLTIQGPGAGLLSVNGNNSSRVFALYGGSATLFGLTVTGGSTGGYGGGLNDENGSVTLIGCTVTGNSASKRGGGLYITGSGSATLTNCTVSDNQTTSRGGGGVFIDSGSSGVTAELTDCTFSGNTAKNAGGGFLNYGGTASVTGCTFNSNSAGTNGGGLYSEATMTLANCTVSGNSASGEGGGVFNINQNVALTNCTMIGNSAAGRGGGLFTNDVAQLTNTIVAGDIVGGDVSGTYTGSNDLIGGNPLVATLGSYGGPTQTIPLLPGSPAIDAGTSSGHQPPISVARAGSAPWTSAPSRARASN